MQIKNKLFRVKRIYIYIISYALFIIFFSTTFLQAKTFKVTDIEISAPFVLSFNKNKVIDNGFRAAFINLISMITMSEDKEKIKKTPLKQIKGMIDSFTISDEKFINDTYYANLEVSFNKKNTLIFLEKKNIFPSPPIKNKILLIPIIVDLENDTIFLFNDNVFYEGWNLNNKNFHLLEYLLPSEDIEDLNIVQNNYKSIEDYDFLELIKKYDLNDYIISIVFKNKNELKVLSKINLNNSFIIDNQKFKDANLDKEKDFLLVLDELKNVYENYWKKNNQINTSIKLPITISINSKDYLKIQELEKVLNSLDLVSDFYILKFDNISTYFKIIYNGSPKTFLNDMDNKNIKFTMKNNIWNIE